MLLSILVSPEILLTPVSMINFCSAIAVFLLGVVILSRGPKNPSNQLAFGVAFFLFFWAITSTLSDVMHSYDPAKFWTQVAILGPYFFGAFFLLFAYYFPFESRRLRWWKLAIILLPAMVVLFLVRTPYNVVEIRLADWGTDFLPGQLYPIGILYLLVYLIAAAIVFRKKRKQTDDPVVKKQISILYYAVAFETFSMIFTNALLPIAFGYTKASVVGPAASLFFVVMLGYAIVRHKFLDIKVLATELFAILLAFINFIDLFYAQSTGQYLLRFVALVFTIVAGIFLIISVRVEIKRRMEKQELSEKLAMLNVHLEEIDRAKSEFLSIASHELRTPMSVIKGYLSLIMEGAYGPVSKPMRDRVEQIYSMNERLVHMIGNLLNLSRIEKGKIEYACSRIQVEPMLHQVIEELSYKGAERSIKLELAHVEGDLPYVCADADKLREVFSNLIDNAIKYSQNGTVTVSTRKDPAGEVVTISVKDNGIGMTEEESKKLFTKYYRTENAKKTTTSGIGLGLYICFSFVKDMGGKLWIEKSAPQQGTTFAVSIPTTPRGECAKAPMQE